MDQLGKRHGRTVEEACPGCGMTRPEWPRAGVNLNGTDYCCQGCAEGTGCTCRHISAGKRETIKPN